ncbi:Ig-like domain repeat protein [Methanobrevibacter millerae]|nr:Ig-like domain repeat protein [Methanobrevibacter millerae]
MNSANAIETDLNDTIYTDTIPDNSLDSLRDIIETSQDNTTINIDNEQLIAPYNFSPITINRSISIIGEDTIIQGNGNGNLFIINNNVTLKNLRFTNTVSYTIINNGNLILENCTFEDLWENAINNTGNLKIIDSTFENIKSIYTNKNINSLTPYYQNKGVIYNTGTLTIDNSRFNNITTPNQITFNNQSIVKKEGMIYNLNETNILNTNFTKITGRLINNTGKLRVENSVIENIYADGINIEIDTKSKEYNITYSGQPEGLIVYNTNEFILRNTTIKDLYYDAFWSRITKVQAKNGPIYNSGNCSIENSYFENIGVNYEELWSNVNPILRGGAIANYGTLNIKDTKIIKTEAEWGGAIYNVGNATLDNITSRLSTAFTQGYSIYNENEIIITNSVFDENNDKSYSLGSLGVIHNHDGGNCKLINSTIKNNRVEYDGSWPETYHGVVQNGGNMEIERCVFYNNKPDDKYSFVSGSYNIYNWGNMIATHNLFLETGIDEPYHWYEERNDPFAYAYNNAGTINMNYNYFDFNSNPFEIYTNFDVNNFFILDLEPEYSALKIGEKTNITATLKLDNGKFYKNYDLLPDIYVTFKVNGQEIVKKLIDGKATVEFNQSDKKGSYTASVILGNCSVSVDIDVGKNYSQMDVKANDIFYGDDAIFYINVSGNLTHQPTGKVSVIIDKQTYTTEIKNGKAKLIISKLKPDTYNVKVRYEGDEDYCKSFHYQNFTVSKRPTNMNISIDEIYYGGIGILKVTLTPETVSTQAYLHITDENNQTTRKTVYIRNGTELKLKNYAAGEYNLTLEMWENSYYLPSNATAIFKVNKYLTNITINASDINAGETEILNITLLPIGEVAGEANLTINNYTQIIFLKNGQNTVKIENLAGGIYNVTVTFPGDKKYTASTATCTFTVIKLQSNITARIENNILYINATPNTTGLVLIYINDDIYEVNLTNSQIILPINFTKAENNIFIYYQGDKNFNYSMCNLTYECEELLNLTGYDSLFYNTENATIYITLTDEEGYGIANRTITITVNNETYTRITRNDGSVELELDLLVGSYEITSQYRNKTTTNTIKVIEDAFILANDTKAYENVDFTYTLILVDHNENPIKNAEITFNFENRTFSNKTDNSGKITLNFNLKEGNYTITSSYKSVNHTNQIIIVDDSHLMGNDIKAYSGTNFTYKTKLTDHNNNPIENATITFTIGNETFTNKTNSKGESTLTFNLETGIYTITAQYKNRTIENTFEIIEDYILRGNDVKAYSETNFAYRVNLTDHNGKAIQNAEITFNINGENHINTTNNNGQAVLNLNLKGGNYIITVNYRSTSTTNNIEIVEDFLLIGNDVKAYAEDNFTYKVNLTDHNGNPVKNAEIIFSIENKTFTNKTNDNGQATLTLSLEEGNYTIKATYKNTTTTNNLEINEDHQITGQNIKAYENTDFTYTITLTRTDGTPLTNKTITFIINNRRYTNTTNEEGKASRTLNLPANNYTITSIYKNTSIKNNLTIISEDYVLQANNIRAYSQRDFQYKVNLTDNNGNPVKNAEIIFILENETFINKTDDNGQAILNLNLEKGNYTIKASYGNAKITNHFEIIETYTLKGINVKSYENFDFRYIVKLTNHNNKTMSNEEIIFTIENKTYTNKTDINGQATLTLNLKEGNYTISAKYADVTTTNQLNIIKYDLEIIESYDLTMYYKDGSKFTARLLKDNTPLINKTVQFIINGNTYSRTTDNEGYARIAINLNSGTHNITSKYNNITKTNTITIKSTINGSDITKMHKNNTQYYATFYNTKGEALKNTDIQFNINGVLYTRTTNEKGIAKMNINLNPGTYIITAINPNSTEQHTNTITVISKIQENKDLTKYYKNNSQYMPKIIKSDGTTAKAGEKVTFNINGVFYERYTNETGHVKMNINLNPGTYIITADYEGCQASNKITVLPTLTAKDLTKKYGTKEPFEVMLVNGQGQAYANEKITFNINGVFYERTTNEDGIAKLNINLMPGKYIITSTHNGLNIANTVTVKE